MNKDKLKQIIENLLWVERNISRESIPSYVLTNRVMFSNDVILENAVKIYISELINESKKENIQSMKEQKEEKAQELATEKQIELLKDLGMRTIPENLSKIEASTIISMNLERRKEVKESDLNKKGVKNDSGKK